MKCFERTKLVSCFTPFACLLLLLLGGCSAADTDNGTRLADQQAQAFAELQETDTAGVDPALAAALADELSRVLAKYGTARQAATPPMTSANQVSDLLAADDGSGGADLTWTFRCVGDYDQNGEVNAADITPVGLHFGATSASPNWDSAQLADGDGNGEVNFADVTPIGLYFNNQLSGYKVFASMDEADYPADPDAVNGAGAVEAGEILLSAAGSGPGGRKQFAVNLGSHTPGTNYWVRPFDAVGALGSASNMATLGMAVSTWTHSWGAGGYEGLQGIAYHKEGAVYAAGIFTFNFMYPDVLLLKYDLDGNLIWARKWGSSGDELATGVAIGSEGEVYVAGSTTSFGAGGKDLLLQRWDRDGNLIWSKTWGGSNDDSAETVAFMQDAVYIAGDTKSFTDPTGDVLLLKYNPEGEVQWARTLGGNEQEDTWDMQALWSFTLQQTTLHITGNSRSYPVAGTALLYARISEDGDAEAVSIWQGGNSQTGTCISASGALPPTVYIGGEADGGKILLLEYSTQPDAVAKTWQSGDHQHLADLLKIDSKLIGCGSFGTGVQYSGLVINFSLDGAVQGAEARFNSGTCLLNEIDYIPGFGLAGCGDADAADNGSWGATAGTLADIAGTWSVIADSTESVTGATANQSLAPEEPVGAVIDEGGGGGDTLVFTRPAP